MILSCEELSPEFPYEVVDHWEGKAFRFKLILDEDSVSWLKYHGANLDIESAEQEVNGKRSSILPYRKSFLARNLEPPTVQDLPSWLVQDSETLRMGVPAGVLRLRARSNGLFEPFASKVITSPLELIESDPGPLPRPISRKAEPLGLSANIFSPFIWNAEELFAETEYSAADRFKKESWRLSISFSAEAVRWFRKRQATLNLATAEWVQPEGGRLPLTPHRAVFTENKNWISPVWVFRSSRPERLQEGAPRHQV